MVIIKQEADSHKSKQFIVFMLLVEEKLHYRQNHYFPLLFFCVRARFALEKMKISHCNLVARIDMVQHGYLTGA